MHTQLVAEGRRHERRARFADYHRSGSLDLRERLVKRHLPLARRLAVRFARRGVPVDDLYQVASIGLIQAVDRFDPGRGVPFAVYAAPTIIGEIKHHFRDRGWDLRVPRRMQELHLAVNAAVDRLGPRLGRSPTISELARAVGAADEEVVEAIEAGASYNARSISETTSRLEVDLHRNLVDALGEEDPQMDAAEDRLVVTGILADLEPREKLIVRLYFWDRLSQDDIADRLGISQMHVSRLLRDSLAELRVALGVGR